MAQHYFGSTSHAKGDMVGFVKDTLAKTDPKQVQAIVAALSAEAGLKSQAAEDARDTKQIAEGQKLIEKQVHGLPQVPRCGRRGKRSDLTGWGSTAWIDGMIRHPSGERFYGDNNDRMPSFAEFAEPERNRLSPQELETIVRWLRGEWYEPPMAPAAPAGVAGGK